MIARDMTRAVWYKSTERTDLQEEMLEGPRLQQWHKGLRPKTAAMRLQVNEESKHKTAAAS
jgi:hypothetical protein